MNPMKRQHAIREYELFVSGGVLEIASSVHDPAPRAAGEYRVLRSAHPEPTPAVRDYPGTPLGEVTIDLSTGELIDN